MILTPGEPVVDVPGGSVAQVVIVHERSATGKIRRATALMRVSEVELRRMAARPLAPGIYAERAMPSYWCPRGDGGIELWPRPAVAYEIEVMAVGGRPIGDARRKPVDLPTVAEFSAAINRSYDDQQKNPVVPQRIERFTLASDE